MARGQREFDTGETMGTGAGQKDARRVGETQGKVSWRIELGIFSLQRADALRAGAGWML